MTEFLTYKAGGFGMTEFLTYNVMYTEPMSVTSYIGLLLLIAFCIFILFALIYALACAVGFLLEKYSAHVDKIVEKER